eukprot:1159916-Pelagomonas_calceolata.AAC.1
MAADATTYPQPLALRAWPGLIGGALRPDTVLWGVFRQIGGPGEGPLSVWQGSVMHGREMDVEHAYEVASTKYLLKRLLSTLVDKVRGCC